MSWIKADEYAQYNTFLKTSKEAVDPVVLLPEGDEVESRVGVG